MNFGDIHTSAKHLGCMCRLQPGCGLITQGQDKGTSPAGAKHFLHLCPAYDCGIGCLQFSGPTSPLRRTSVDTDHRLSADTPLVRECLPRHLPVPETFYAEDIGDIDGQPILMKEMRPDTRFPPTPRAEPYFLIIQLML